MEIFAVPRALLRTDNLSHLRTVPPVDLVVYALQAGEEDDARQPRPGLPGADICAPGRRRLPPVISGSQHCGRKQGPLPSPCWMITLIRGGDSLATVHIYWELVGGLCGACGHGTHMACDQGRESDIFSCPRTPMLPLPCGLCPPRHRLRSSHRGLVMLIIP